jgi:hypothetical protein
MRELLKSLRGASQLALVLLLIPLASCKDASNASPGQPTDAELQAQGYTSMNGYLVPPPQVLDPTLPDSCALLTEAVPGPKELIAEPLAPIERMTSVCIARALDDPTLNHSVAVEVRHPESFEVTASGPPKDLEMFWLAEGGGVDLLGGRRDEVKQIAGLGDYAVWYPIDFGLGLHAYQGLVIARITIRGIDEEHSLAWSKAVAQRALEAAGALGQTPVAQPQ